MKKKLDRGGGANYNILRIQAACILGARRGVRHIILQIKTVQTPFTWEVCTVEKFILVKNKSTYRNCLAVFCPLIGKVDRIFCVWIFHTQ